MAISTKLLKLPTIRRLPQYLRVLREFDEQHIENISTTVIAEHLSLDSITIRKDLSITNIQGKPKVGYCVKELIAAIEEFLGWHNTSEAFLVGVGNLGKALMGYQGFEKAGLKIIAGFDVDPYLIGTKIAGVNIFDLSDLSYLIPRMKVEMMILCVPENHAQEVADVAIKAGIKGIWNFTQKKLNVPDNVVVQREDMASGLAVLSAKLSKLEKDGVQDGQN